MKLGVNGKMGVLDYLMNDETATTGLTDLTDSVKNKGSSSNNVWFRYRSLDFGQSCTIRFLPASEDNISGPFWLPKKIIRLKFADPSNVGQDVNIAIPVMQMYTGGRSADDPILGQVTRLYEEADALEKRGESEKAKRVRGTASAHYIRGESIAQGFVINPGFLETDPPANPIRLFELNKQIIKVITAKLETENPELKLDYWPCHGKKGYNFIIMKTRTGDGKFPKYDDGTGFSTKTTPLSEDHKAALAEHGLWNLQQFLPARPSAEEYEMLAEIVRQSIAGNRVWDSDWEAHLSAVKVYRTARVDGDDPAVMQDEVRAVMSRPMASQPASAAADVLSQISRTQPRDEPEVATDEEDEIAEEIAVVPSKTASEVRSIVDSIKRRQAKTATAADAD
jgi:hypothetical protein